MHLFILLFSDMKTAPNNVPIKSIVLVLWAGFIFLLSVLYTASFNPELKFLKYAWNTKNNIIQASVLDDSMHSHKGRVLFSGGSSVLVGIDPEEISRVIGRPVLNLGMAAGMGPKVLSSLALEQVREGDLLVISLEPDLLTLPQKSLMLGSQIAWITGHPSWMAPQSPDRWIVSLSHLRPGAYHALTLLGKLITGKPLYRYSKDEISPNGWQEIKADSSNLGWPVFSYKLTAEGGNILKNTFESCQQIGAQCLYIPSFHYCPQERMNDHKAGMKNFLENIAQIMPVLSPSDFNCSNDEALFADTPWHPAPQEAIRNSQRMASLLGELDLGK